MQDGFNAENISLPLENVVAKELYNDPITYQTVQTRNVTMNNHERGIEPNQFLRNDKLRLLWEITSTNQDKSGRPFVSTIEPVDPDRFPIYGVQFHPEKNAFEYIPYEAIDHSDEGVAFSAYMARFFGRLARKGMQDNPYHSYRNYDLYPLVGTYPMHTGNGFEQVYDIPAASHWINDSSNTLRAKRRL